MPYFVNPVAPGRLTATPGMRPATAMVRRLRVASLFIFLSMLIIGSFITVLHWYMTRDGGNIPMESPYFVNNLVTLHAMERLDGTDSWSPMLSVRNWLQLNPDADAYEHFFFGLRTKFQYPLTSLLTVQWLPFAGFTAIRFLNVMATLAWLFMAGGMMLLDLQLARLLGLSDQSDQRGFRLWICVTAVTATVCFYPLMRAVYLGQIQIFLDVLFVFSCYFFVRGQSGWAGALIGLSALVKPQMALFLLWGAVRRDRAFVAGVGACCIAGYVFSGLLYGWNWPVSYLRVLGYIGQHGESFYANQSFNGLLNRMIGNGPNLLWDGGHFAPYNEFIRWITLFFTLAFIIGALWIARMAASHLAATTSLMVSALCFTAASPVAWEHHYGIILPLFSLAFLAVLGNRYEPVRQKLLWTLLGTTFVLIANSWAPVNFLADTALNFLQSYLFIGVLGVLVLVFMLRHELGWSDRT
ncbi:MAG: DUF2029 domain-containing protein [Komagataeibacter hansenii]|nr:DUF2029 domain-containing protein [Novacetimonas hansenii]